LLTFFIFEILIAALWVGTVEKAAQLGARLAIVADPAVTGLPASNAKPSQAVPYGASCGVVGNCTDFGTLTCTGGTAGPCAATGFSNVITRMTSIASLISQGCAAGQPGCRVTISYTYVGLGFAGGPTIPSVVLSVSGVPYGAVVTKILGSFFGGSPILTTLPDISVTFTGEDLSSAGA
jgi:hypothetical protein